jgi:hypothetical protein
VQKDMVAMEVVVVVVMVAAVTTERQTEGTD